MVSVCIATYNGEKYIYEQLSSILGQLQAGDEIIISDDSSTDSTLKIIYDFNDNRIKVYKNQKFSNPIFNFENALKHATGDLIFLSDQDDIWNKEKVRKMLQVLEKTDMVVCNCSFINDKNEIIVDSYFDVVKSAPGLIRNLKKNTYFGCCMAFNKKVLEKSLPFPKDIPMHDIWLGFVAEIFFKSEFLAETLTYYRKHSNNASIASDVVSNLSLITKLRFRINIIKYLPTLLLR